MINRAYIELESVKGCAAIARIDGSRVSSSKDEYVEENKLSYYIAINTWLMLVNDFSTPAYLRLRTVLHREGLVATIRRFADSADELVHGYPVSDDLVRNILHDVEQRRKLKEQPRFETDRKIWADPMATSLFICRYLKRFCPLKADLYDRALIEDFLQNQNRIKMLQRREVSPYMKRFVKQQIARIDFDNILEEIRSLDETDLEITHGVGFDAKAPLVSKLKALRRSHPSFFYQPFGVNMTPVAVTEESSCEVFGHYKDPYHPARMATVPKNYKTNRLIAMEDTYRQALAKAVFRIIDAHLPKPLNLHDQGQNQDYARLGSLDGLWATIDLHAASDSVSWVLCKEIFPTRFIRVLEEIRPTHIIVNGKARPIYAFATMGNAETFVIETIVFWSIVSAACEFAAIFGIPNDGMVIVYGDDIICPTCVAEIAIEWLEAFGFIVNKEKSFFELTSAYRESCGEEYHMGVCVSSLYYPRFAPRGQISDTSVVLSDYISRDGFTGEMYDSTSRLVDLQHKLAYLSDTASSFVAEIVREANPRMTCSPFGTVCSDLWDYESRPVLGPVPLGEMVSERILQRSGNKFVTKEKRHIKRQKSEHMREGHSVRVDSYRDMPKDAVGERLYDLYKYQQFLKHGPTYDEMNIVMGEYGTVNFNKLAGISSRPAPYNRVAGQASSKWVFHY